MEGRLYLLEAANQPRARSETAIDNAQAALKHAIELKSDSAESYRALARSCYLRAGLFINSDSDAARQCQSGIDAIRRAISLNPTLSFNYLTLGELLKIMGQLEKEPSLRTKIDAEAKGAFAQARSINKLLNNDIDVEF